MNRILTAIDRLRGAIRLYRVQLGLSLRVTLAAVATMVLSQALGVPLYLWAVLTAVVLTQVSFGRSLKAAIDYLIGTLGGVIYAGAIGVFVPHTDKLGLAAALALAVAPVSLLASIRPAFTVAPFTAVLVILTPTLAHVSPIESALYRLVEVMLGGMTALVVSFLVFPARAHDLTIEAAARMLDLLAQAIRKISAGFSTGLDVTAIDLIQNRLGAAFADLERIGAEAKRERISYLASRPDQAPLLRTLLRLRHDLVMIGRSAVKPLPDALRSRLGGPLLSVAATASDFMHQCAVSLPEHGHAPPLELVQKAVADYTAEIEAIREEGLMRTLPADTVERVFALHFAMEQLSQNFRDLQRCVTESAHSPITARDTPAGR